MCVLRARNGDSALVVRGKQFAGRTALDDHAANFRERHDHERRCGVEFVVRSQNDGFGRALCQRSFDGGFFGVAGRRTDIGTQAGDAHEKDVGADARDGLHGAGADRHGAMFEAEKPTSNC